MEEETYTPIVKENLFEKQGGTYGLEKMEDGEEVLIPNIKMPKIIDQSRLKRYEQSRKDLGDLFSKLKVYTIFANNDENADSFNYQVFPSSETEILINNFMNNISRIYIRRNKRSQEKRCLIYILELKKYQINL